MGTKDDLIRQLANLATTEDEKSQMARDIAASGILVSDTTSDKSDVGALTKALSTMTFNQSFKMSRFQSGQNFSRFCERFLEYVATSNMDDDTERCYTFFLQHLDDETYSLLKAVDVQPAQRRSVSTFINLFKTATYGDESIQLKNDLINCKQKSEETISHFVYRLREQATIAYSSENEAEELCLLAFLRGIHVPRIKRKMNESVLTTFKAAIALAKRLERAVELEQETSTTTETVSILKESVTEIGDTPHLRRHSDNSRSRSANRSYSHDRSDSRNRSPYRRNNRFDRDRSNSRGRSSNRYDRDFSNNLFDRDRSNSRGRSSNRYNRDSSPDRFSNEASNPNQSSHQRNVSHGHQNRNKSDILCWTCLNPGHYSKNCYSNPNRRSNRRDYKSNNVRFSDNLN